MPDLIAQGPQPDDRWRRHLQAGDRVSIGRQSGRWSTPWDNHISRRHVEVVCEGSELVVQTLPGATNPVFFLGQPADQFRLKAGEQFVIGKTTFLLIDPQSSGASDLPGPTEERTFVTKELHQRPFREPDKRIQSLSRLPDIIHRSANDQELFQRLVKLLLSGVERATAAAVVSVEQTRGPAVKDAAVSVLHRDHHHFALTDFRPSHRLIRQAVTSGHSMAYVWGHEERGSQPDFTSSGHTEWAICTPVLGEATPGWALYVAGNFSQALSGPGADAELLHDDVKYTEIMGATLGGLLQSRRLAARQASLSQFFSPVVLHAINASDPEHVLNPREAELTVLFCDLRGFTSESERSAHDLFGLLNRVSDALGVMTRAILNQGGVIGDFHGDAAMGFWGWPIAQLDAAMRACRAALDIRAHFEQADSCGNAAKAEADPKHRFRVGIGIASGRAVAGKIGTADQVKVTAFGPVVNLAARLETMTRQLPALILVDSTTADSIRAALGPTICRVRRLARVLPVGLSAPIDVSEILPPAAACPDLGDEGLSLYESALFAFESGDWHQAGQLLAKVPNADQAKDLLLQFILESDGAPPPDWDGALRLATK